jgi:sulfide:quinone oxidoreductase
MSDASASSEKFRVVVVGGGVAALETALALNDLAPDRVSVAVVAPNDEFVYRPLTVREPFSYGSAQRHSLAAMVAAAGAELVVDELAYVDPEQHVVHLRDSGDRDYHALVLALGAKAKVRYEHATTIDDGAMDSTLHGIVQDVEGGYIQSLAFVAPGRMPWPMAIYDLALMTAARAYDMGVTLDATIVTPEDSPLAVFGTAASEAVARLLEGAGISVMTSAYAEVPEAGRVVVNPGDRRLTVDRVIALPELFGPELRGVPLGEHGFLHVDPHGRLLGVEGVYAAGDATDFPIKQGGLASQQADAVAESIAAVAGADISPEPFQPTMRGVLMTGAKPLYLSATITGGQGSDSQASESPSWSPAAKIAARYLAPYLDSLEHESDAAGGDDSP